MDNGHWKYKSQIDPEEWFGFIYRIVNEKTGQHYVGKKQFWSTNRKVVKGRKNRKKVIKASPWKKYTGSCKKLNADIEIFGMANFTFVIESLHKSKASLYYAEVEKQVKEDVLRAKMDSGIPKYYNGNIAAVKFIPPSWSDKELESFYSIFKIT
jgi:hypothetical protein